MKTILLISDFAYSEKSAGTERFINGLAEWLNSHGFKADVLTPNWDRNNPNVSRINGVNVFRFKIGRASCRERV